MSSGDAIRSCGRGSGRAKDSFRDRLGVQIREEVLPLSCTAAYFRPFWLAGASALAFA